MNLIKRLISSVLCVALLVSLLVIPSVAVDDGLFSISFSAQDNYTYDEQNEVTSVKAGDTFYLFVNFARQYRRTQCILHGRFYTV